jgi:hypothetical protein
MDPQDLHNYLYKNNTLYKNSFDKRIPLTICINACNTGLGFGAQLSRINPYLNVRAPNTYLSGWFNSFSCKNSSYDSSGAMLWFNNGKQK